MTHKVQQILDAFKSTLNPLTTNGDNIEIGRPYNVDQEELTWINIRQGPAEKLSGNWQVSDWDLTVQTEISAKETSSNTPGEIVNQIYDEMVVALDPNPQSTQPLGLSFVESIEELAATAMTDEFQIVPVSGLIITWSVMFRRSVSNPSA